MRLILKKTDRVFSEFVYYNQRGLVSAVLFVIVMLVLFSYIVAVYSTFRDGFALQEMVHSSRKLSEKVVGLQVSLEQLRNNFDTRNSPTLDQMEKVSSIRYIESGSVAALLVPHSSQ